jgi:hypothetical protein
MRPIIHNVIATIRASAAARWSTVQQLRLETRVRLSERRASRYHARRLSAGRRVSPREASETWLEAEVRRVIGRHPEGICARDIGNELGVDWRRVPTVTCRLLERAVIEQVEQDFYPVRKAS